MQCRYFPDQKSSLEKLEQHELNVQHGVLNKKGASKSVSNRLKIFVLLHIPKQNQSRLKSCAGFANATLFWWFL